MKKQKTLKKKHSVGSFKIRNRNCTNNSENNSLLKKSLNEKNNSIKNSRNFYQKKFSDSFFDNKNIFPKSKKKIFLKKEKYFMFDKKNTLSYIINNK